MFPVENLISRGKLFVLMETCFCLTPCLPIVTADVTCFYSNKTALTTTIWCDQSREFLNLKIRKNTKLKNLRLGTINS